MTTDLDATCPDAECSHPVKYHTSKGCSVRWCRCKRQRELCENPVLHGKATLVEPTKAPW